MNPKQLLVWVVGLTLCVIDIRPYVHSAQKPSGSSLATGGPIQEEYEIWNLAVENVIEHSRPPEMVLISDETASPPAESEYGLESLLDSRPTLPQGRQTQKWIALRAELLPETRANFQQKNQTTNWLANNFRLPLRTVTIAERELSRLHAKAPDHFWETLRAKYPHAIGVFRVSRIGFSSSRTQAIVYIQYQSGPEGGDGRYVLLQKKNGVWTCRTAAIAWMS